MLVERNDIQYRPTNIYLVTTKRYHEQSTQSTNASPSNIIIFISSYNETATTDCNKAGSTTDVQTTVNNENATLAIDHKFTDQQQVQQWAIPIDTGAMPSVASPDHFPHTPLKHLRAQNPKTLTAVKLDQLNMHGIKQLTMVFNNLATAGTDQKNQTH
eukprot:1794391-Amphidinium_carterae.1